MVYFITYGDFKTEKNGSAKFTSAFVNLLDSSSKQFKVINFYDHGLKNRLIRKIIALFYYLFKNIPLPVGYFYSYKLISAIDKELMKKHATNMTTTIVIDHLELSYIAKFLYKKHKNIRFVHLSHNQETEIFRQRFTNKTIFFLLNIFSSYEKYEKSVFSMFDVVFTISHTEKEIYLSKYLKSKIYVLPPLFTYKPKIKFSGNVPLIQNKYKLIFVADFSWYPNLDAYNWIIDTLLPELPDNYKIFFYGNNQDKLLKPNKEYMKQVSYCGFVDDINEIWQDAFFSIAPMRKGAGINIKIAESLYNKVPVITSELGAKGFDEKLSKSIITCKLDPKVWVETLQNFEQIDKYSKLKNSVKYPTKKDFVEILNNEL